MIRVQYLATNFTSNAMNEYTAVGGTTHVYDSNGNLTDDGTNLYSYDFHNHLVKVVDKGTSTTIAEYEYDAVGRGRRTAKVVGSDTTRFIYHGQHVLEELDGSDTLLRLFAYADGWDNVVMMEAPDVADVDNDANTTELKRFYYHTQLIGSITHITDDDEVVVESYEYDAYGNTTIYDINSSSVSSSQIENPYMYTARRMDEETDLYHYRARAYSPKLMRFIQRDPLEYVDGPNAMAYVGGRSTRSVDPDGLWERRRSGRLGDENRILLAPDIHPSEALPLISELEKGIPLADKPCPNSVDGKHRWLANGPEDNKTSVAVLASFVAPMNLTIEGEAGISVHGQVQAQLEKAIGGVMEGGIHAAAGLGAKAGTGAEINLDGSAKLVKELTGSLSAAVATEVSARVGASVSMDWRVFAGYAITQTTNTRTQHVRCEYCPATKSSTTRKTSDPEFQSVFKAISLYAEPQDDADEHTRPKTIEVGGGAGSGKLPLRVPVEYPDFDITPGASPVEADDPLEGLNDGR